MHKVMIGIPCLGFNKNLYEIHKNATLNGVDVYVYFNFLSKNHLDENLDSIKEFVSKTNCINEVYSREYDMGLLKCRLNIFRKFVESDYDYLINFDCDDTLIIPNNFQDKLKDDLNYIIKFNFEVNEFRTGKRYSRYTCKPVEYYSPKKFEKDEFFPGVAFSVFGKEIASKVLNNFTYTSVPRINLCEDLAITLMAISSGCGYSLVSEDYLGYYNNYPVSTTFSNDPDKDYEKVTNSLNYVFFVLKPFFKLIDNSWLRYIECVTKSYSYYVVKKKYEGISYS